MVARDKGGSPSGLYDYEWMENKSLEWRCEFILFVFISLELSFYTLSWKQVTFLEDFLPGGLALSLYLSSWGSLGSVLRRFFLAEFYLLASKLI